MSNASGGARARCAIRSSADCRARWTAAPASARLRRSQRGGSDTRMPGIHAIAIDIPLGRNFVRRLVLVSPSHGENRGSSPLGSANKINRLFQTDELVSNNCPINVYGQAWTACRFFGLGKLCDAQLDAVQILHP